MFYFSYYGHCYTFYLLLSVLLKFKSLSCCCKHFCFCFADLLVSTAASSNVEFTDVFSFVLMFSLQFLLLGVKIALVVILHLLLFFSNTLVAFVIVAGIVEYFYFVATAVDMSLVFLLLLLLLFWAVPLSIAVFCIQSWIWLSMVVC